MKRKRDKKYLLTIGTCIGLLIVMIISLTNKGTYSYISCMGIIAPDNSTCCDSKSNFSNEVGYANESIAFTSCKDYALSKTYDYYDCSVGINSNGKFIWNLVSYHGCYK